MAVYMYLTLALAAFAVVAARTSECPNVGCTLELRPGQVQAPRVMVYEGKICTLCDKWMLPAPKLDDSGCPLIPCLAIGQECPRNSYIAWDGKLCPDCNEDFCGSPRG